MSDEARQLAYREQRARQRLFQRLLDAMLTPASPLPAALVRQRWNPILQLQSEGPHVGEREDPDEESVQRI